MNQNHVRSLLKHRFLGLSPRISDSLGLEWSPRIFISNTFPGVAASLEIVFRGSLSYSRLFETPDLYIWQYYLDTCQTLQTLVVYSWPYNLVPTSVSLPVTHVLDSTTRWSQALGCHPWLLLLPHSPHNQLLTPGSSLSYISLNSIPFIPTTTKTFCLEDCIASQLISQHPYTEPFSTYLPVIFSKSNSIPLFSYFKPSPSFPNALRQI